MKEPVVCFEDIIAMHVPIISTMEALTLLMKRWNGYLAYVMDDNKVTPILEEILVVRDFLEVFLEKLSGLCHIVR